MTALGLPGTITSLTATRSESVWALLDSGVVCEINPVAETALERVSIQLPRTGADASNGRPAPRDEHPRLLVSDQQDLLAVVIDYGRYGRVYRADTGECIQELDCGDYYSSMTPFGAEFTTVHGATTLIHRTDWNRLDATVYDPDPRPLTARADPVESAASADTRFQDYFVGNIALNTDHTRVLTDGWIWTPVGAQRAFSLPAWLIDNPWESEDGASLWRRNDPTEDWDYPLCWIDADSYATMGRPSDIFREEDEPQPADTVSIVNISTGVEATFLGPEPLRIPGRRTLFHARGHLLSVEPDGLSIWRLSDGSLAHHLPGLNPELVLGGANRIVSPSGDTCIILPLPEL